MEETFGALDPTTFRMMSIFQAILHAYFHQEKMA
jgi:hypothetical protein